MNIILIDTNEIHDNTVVLEDRRANHILKILHSAIGDSLRIGIINGQTGLGYVEQLKQGQVTLTLDINGPFPKQPQTDLLLALPRPIMLKRVLVQATTLGVGQIFLTNAKRVEKSFFGASLLQEENYRPFLLHGLEQAIDTILPKVHIHKRFKPFMEDILAPKLDNYANRLIAHPNTAKNLWQQAPPPIQGRALLAIGPEGGWIEYEIEKFKELGFSPFSLGPRILRVDTAIPAILGQFNLLRTVE